MAPPEARGTPEATLVLHLHPSRRQAREAAVGEAVALLRDLGARPLAGGPLSEIAGIAWVAVPEAAVGVVAERLGRLGYSEAVDVVRPALQDAAGLAAAAGMGDPAGAAAGAPAGPGAATPGWEPGRDGPWRRARWKRRDVVLVPLVRQDAEAWQATAPHRRSFLLECGDGVVRRIAGYRGGRGPLEHRALPVADARLLVNLAASPAGGRLLDPFAGAGGVVVEATGAGWQVCSLDADPALRHGLAELAAGHVIGDARALPFATGSFAAVATEPPYHAGAGALVEAAVGEVARVLRTGGRAAMLAGAAQAGPVRAAAARAGLLAELDTAVNRKGTPVVAFCWRRG